MHRKTAPTIMVLVALMIASIICAVLVSAYFAIATLVLAAALGYQVHEIYRRKKSSVIQDKNITRGNYKGKKGKHF